MTGSLHACLTCSHHAWLTDSAHASLTDSLCAYLTDSLHAWLTDSLPAWLTKSLPTWLTKSLPTWMTESPHACLVYKPPIALSKHISYSLIHITYMFVHAFDDQVNHYSNKLKTSTSCLASAVRGRKVQLLFNNNNQHKMTSRGERRKKTLTAGEMENEN